MKSKFKKIILVAIVMLMVAQPAFADIVFCGKRADTQGTPGNESAPCTVQDLFLLVYVVVNYLISMAGLVALLFIVWGGIQMLMARGDSGKQGEAKKTILHAVMGLVLVLMTYMIIGYVAGLFLPDATDPLRELVNFITRQ
jgi:hypothetical protein